MRQALVKFSLLGIGLFPISTLADAEMFRPFQPYIDCKFGRHCCEGMDCMRFNRERYQINRTCPSEYWKKQQYFRRHCGSAYVNCIYPDEDYPRINGRPFDVRWYQRQPYYPPFR